MLNLLPDNLIQGLACAVLAPGLRGILVFDASSTLLQCMANTLIEMLTVVKTPPDQVQLSSVEDEDTLWGNLALGVFLPLHQGLLRNRGETPRIIIVPHLPRLSLAAQRAAMTMLDSDTVSLERHGQHEHWHPNVWWLAACPRDHIGEVSPHLLDRFTLRLPGSPLSYNADRVGVLGPLLNHEGEAVNENVLSKAIHDQLYHTQQRWPVLDRSALGRVVELFPTNVSQRREIALARMSVAMVRFKGGSYVTAADVDDAATLMGMLSPLTHESDVQHLVPEPAEQTTESWIDSIIPPSSTSDSDRSSDSKLELPTSPAEAQVFESDAPETFPASADVTASSDPYPEDLALPNRDAFSLRLPLRRLRAISHAQGYSIGFESATKLRDIAIVPTLLSAMWYQAVRNQNNGKLRLSPSDIKSYRRTAVAEQMLMLLIDYTCLKERDWETALLPHIRWAYVERATICLIQVGVSVEERRHELQAHKIEAQSILVPRINHALGSPAGNATPLAHGFELVVQTLQHVLQHGRSTVHHVRLVVITDGRGNVPLSASHNLVYPSNIKRQGIDDAIEIGAIIHQFKGVRSIVLNPQPDYYADLPVTIANILGADIEVIPSLVVEENEL